MSHALSITSIVVIEDLNVIEIRGVTLVGFGETCGDITTYQTQFIRRSMTFFLNQPYNFICRTKSLAFLQNLRLHFSPWFLQINILEIRHRARYVKTCVIDAVIVKYFGVVAVLGKVLDDSRQNEDGKKEEITNERFAASSWFLFGWRWFDLF